MLKKHLLVAVLIVANLVTPSTATSAWAMPNQYLPREPDQQRAVVEWYVRHLFGDDADIMLVVAECESTGLVHLTPDGRLLPNRRGSGAIGVFQLMPVHFTASKSALRDLGKYMEVVHKLHQDKGLQPWDSSKKCWEKKVDELRRLVKNNKPEPPVEVAEARD